jgi:hypothetical protein
VKGGLYLTDKERLERLYIKNKNQHILANDGYYITFYEVCDSMDENNPVIAIHQSDEDEDTCVYVEMIHLEQIIREVTFNN